jgi:hypothetical protein
MAFHGAVATQPTHPNMVFIPHVSLFEVSGFSTRPPVWMICPQEVATISLDLPDPLHLQQFVSPNSTLDINLSA